MGSQQAVVHAVEADEPVRRLLTVDDVLTLDAAGAFDGIGKVELIDGDVYVMAPLYLPHATMVAALTIAIGYAVDALGSELVVLSPVSAKMNDHSLPEADIMLADISGNDGTFVRPEMVKLAVEVAATSLAHDLGMKLALYARSGVPEYWVADVNGRSLIRFHAPVGDSYAERVEFGFGMPVPSATIPGLIVDTARLA